ncbi:hypothetical protein UACE39S_00079 [Ureibacillus acetophenoni]
MHATYLAQTEMEIVYKLSTEKSLSSFTTSSLSIPGYTLKNNKTIKTCDATNRLDTTEYSSEIIFEKPLTDNKKSVVTIRPLCDFPDSTTILINIIDQNNTIKATVENVYVWKKD